MTWELKQAHQKSAVVAEAAQGMKKFYIVVLILKVAMKRDVAVMTTSYFLGNILSQTCDGQANQEKENLALVPILQLMNLK